MSIEKVQTKVRLKHAIFSKTYINSVRINIFVVLFGVMCFG